ncbi:HU family DNA-binding protein [Dehalobacter sp. TeCB1]|jgi:hypothetical protein|uniref:HU family DNA-binding protein n=1 Tax=Dehalobacter sp. TeCB1 TaxID=1843715 RepID=UPI001146A030|nr:HU family DNA-binding protein [Dehalobacter sp. TeCB1]
MNKLRSIHQSQLLSEIAEDSGLTIATVKKAFESYEKVSKDRIMEGKKVPLPGGMGYIYLALSRSKPQDIYLKLTDSHTTILPKLRTFVSFSDPWKEFINSNLKTPEIIKKLLDLKK